MSVAINSINQIGAREDLSDKLAVADMKSTPLVTMIRKGKKPTKTIFDWPVAGVPAPDTAAVADGDPVENFEDMSGARALLHGRVHKVRRGVSVSEMAEDVNVPAGIDSEFKFAKLNALKAVKRAIEAVFCGDQDSSLAGRTHTTRGLGSWIKATAQTDLPVDANYLTPAASIDAGVLTSLTEEIIRGVMQSIYAQTGQMGDWDGLFGIALKSEVSQMTIFRDNVSNNTIVRTFFAQLEKNTLEAVIDVIRGDFGTIRIHPTLWNNFSNTTKLGDTKRGYILDMDDLEMRANRLPGFKPLPEDDSGPKGVVSAIVALQMGNPLQHGKLAET